MTFMFLMGFKLGRGDLERVLQNIKESFRTSEKVPQRRIVVLTDSLQQMVHYGAQISRLVSKLDEELTHPEQTVVFVSGAYDNPKYNKRKNGDYVIRLSHYFNEDCLKRLRQNIRDGLPLPYRPPVFEGCNDIHGE